MNVLLLGDSHTFGWYGRALEGLLRQAGHTVTRVGYVSATANSYLTGGWRKLNLGGVGDFDAAIKRPFDLAIVSLGTNDAAGMGKADAQAAAARIKALTDKVQAKTLWWVGPPAFSQAAAATYNPAFKTWDLNARAEALVAATAALYGSKAIDPRTATQGFVKDKDIHFNEDGGLAWAKFVFDRVSTTGGGGVTAFAVLAVGVVIASVVISSLRTRV